MKLDIRNSRLSLAREALIALRNARGTLITGLRGDFWVTQEGDGRDHVLGPGETMEVCSDGLTVVSALQDGELEFEPGPTAIDFRDPVRNAVPPRWRRWLQRLRLSPLQAAGARRSPGVHRLARGGACP